MLHTMGIRSTLHVLWSTWAKGYLRRGDYQNAYGAYEAAAEKFSGTIHTSSAKHCKENMARIERKQRNPDEVVGFYRPRVDSDKTLFYPVQTSSSHS